MDPKELLSLLGYNEAPSFDAGQVMSGPSDEYVAAQNAPAVNAVSGAGAGQPVVEPRGPGMDFQPKTYDFGNQGARPMDYDNMGNLYELLPNGGSISVKQKQGESGYSSAKMGEIEAGPMGSKKMQAGEAGLYQQARNRYAGLSNTMAQADQGQLEAEDQAGQAEAAAIEARAQGQGKISSLMETHAREFQHLNESTLIAKQQAKDEYRQKLLEIPEVNPNALWDEAGAQGQFQMSVAAFVHDMLGVKGIKTSAMDTINNAIRNKIDAQIANINTKKQVAAGFKDLYDMTVAESGSQMEVQARMHGYMLKAMEAGIDADMGKIDSNVARAKHQQAKMALRQEQIKNLIEVEKHIDTNVDRAAERQVQIRGQNMQAAIAKANRENDLKIAEARAKAAEKPAELPPVVYDTSKSGGGVAKWRIKGAYADDKELQRNIINKTVLTNKAVEGFRELQELQAKIDGAPPALLGRLRSELTRREEALRSTVVSAMVLDTSGKAATDKEYDRIAATVPAQGWFTNGNNRKIIADRVLGKLSEMNDLLKQTTNDVGPNDPAFNTVAAQNVYGDAEGIEAKMTKDDSGEHTPGVTEEALTRIKSPGALLPMVPPSQEDDVQKASEFENYTKPYWEDFKKNANNKTRSLKTGDDNALLWRNPENPPEAFDGIRELAEHAYDGDPSALEQLTALTTPGNQEEGGWQRQEMAKYFLDRIDKKNTAPTAGGRDYGTFGY